MQHVVVGTSAQAHVADCEEAVGSLLDVGAHSDRHEPRRCFAPDDTRRIGSREHALALGHSAISGPVFVEALDPGEREQGLNFLAGSRAYGQHVTLELLPG